MKPAPRSEPMRTHDMTEKAPVAPWYRQPWFWFLTIFPLASMVWGVTAIIVSTNMDNSMVTDDYSREGRGINMAIARDQKAIDMQIEGRLEFSGRDALLTLQTRQGPANFPYLVLNLYHPTLAEYDRIIQFQRRADGEYTGRMLENLDGRWYYDLQGPDNDWRVKGELQLPSDHSIRIDAAGDA